jgi:hypothetical protein
MSKTREIRIYGVNDKLADQLNNIAKNTGTPLTYLLRPKLTEFANSYPDKMKEPPAKE